MEITEDQLEWLARREDRLCRGIDALEKLLPPDQGMYAIPDAEPARIKSTIEFLRGCLADPEKCSAELEGMRRFARMEPA